jgi:hypothetical protein
MLVGSCGLLSAQDPVTLTVDRFEVSTSPGSGFTVDFTKSGGSFTANMSAPALGGGPTITGVYTLALTPNTFDSVTGVNALTLTPMPVFRATLTSSALSVALLASGLNTNICFGRAVTTPASATPTSSFDCPQRFVDFVLVNGVRQAKVVSDVGLGNATASITAYYTFEPPPNHVEFVGEPSPPRDTGITTGKVTFRSRVKYRTNLNAWVALRLYDKLSDGILQGSSEFFSANRTEGETELVIPDFEVKEEHLELYLKAVLINRATETVVVESPTVKYLRPPDISIDRVELVQVVQQPDGGVPLFKDRPTVMRIFIKQKGENDDPFTGITADIRAFYEGGELPLSPRLLNSSGGTGRENPDRQQEGHSLNYLLDFPFETPSIIRYEIELKLPPGRPEDPKDNNKVSVQGIYRKYDRKQINVAIFRVCVRGTCPAGSLTPALEFARRVLPVPGGYLPFGQSDDLRIDWPPPPDDEFMRGLTGASTDLSQPEGLQLLLSYFEAVRLDIDEAHMLLAHLPTFAGDANVVGKTLGIPPPGEVRGTFLVRDGANEGTVAHEMGHALGLRHSNTSDSCGAEDSRSTWRPSTAEIGDPGFDAAGQKFIPSYTKNLMSYCEPRWLAAQQYIDLTYAFKDYEDARRPAVEPTLPAEPRARAAAEEAPACISISGFAERDAPAGGLTNAYETGILAGVSRHRAGASYCLKSFGGGEMLAENCFDLSFEDADGKPLSRAYFSRRIALPRAASRLALFRGDTELAAIAAAGVPTVELLAPTAGAELRGTQVVSWSGSDASGAALSYLLQYSGDGGATWRTLLPSSRATTFELRSDALPSGDGIQLRVVASNGLRTASAVVGNLKVSYTPTLDLPPASLDFGNVQVGQIAEKAVSLKNSGQGVLQVRAVKTDHPGFVVVSSLTGIAAGRPEPLTLRFDPAEAGIQRATLTIETNDPATPVQTIALAGAGFNRPVPNVAVSPAQLDFGEMALGQAKTAEVTISNSGNGPLTVTSLAFSAAVFSSASGRLTVAPGDQAKVTIQYRPTAVGRDTATVTIDSDDPSRPAVQVALAGSGTAPPNSPRIETSVTALDFGTVTVNQPKELPFSIRNTGTAPLTVTAVAISNPRFAIELPSASFTIAAGVTQAFSVRFLPTAAGAQTGNLTITSNDPTRASLVVTLSGTGTTASGPALSYSPASLAFGNVPVGTTQTLTLTVTNTGTAQLTGSLGVSAPFALTPSDLGIMEPGASVNVRVSFTPPAAGPVTGSILGASNDPNRRSFTIGLTGTGGTGSSATGACASPSNISVTPLGVASQSSTAFDGPAGLGNNGEINEPNTYGFHTGLEDSPWWQVDLGAVSTICEVRLYNRVVYPLRTRTLLVRLSTDGTNFDTVYTHDGSPFGDTPLVITTDVANRQARYVRIQLTEREYLHLREVQVFGGSGSTGAGSASISVSPASLSLGSVAVGNSGTATLTVRNTGTATLTGTLSVAAPFSVSPASISIPAVGETTVTVGFSPTAPGTASGTLTIASNDSVRPSLAVSLTGTGAAAGAQSTTLSVDDGTYELGLGLPSGGTVYFVNRLTPPSYPATLESIQIYFGSEADELAAGHPITVLWGANAGGGSNINAVSLTRSSSSVATRGQFNSLTLATPLTINSGDFVVGFTTNNPPNVYPMAVDQTPPLRQRSYVSVDGQTFAIVDSLGSPGNSAIRAVVDIPPQ